MPLENIRVVLVEPIDPGNVGAAARAMKNMGLSSLTLVAEKPLDRRKMFTMAVHAADILETMRVTTSIEDAVADCGKVIGTTARNTRYRAAVRTPRELAPEILAAARHNRVAVLFGREDRGLANREIRYCHEMINIPASSLYACLNLAQAVLVCCYELSLAAARGTGDQGAAATGAGVLANACDLERMFDSLRESLLEIGFLNRENPDHLMFAIRRMLTRRELEDREVRILLGIARQMSWAARRAAAARQQR